MASPNVDVSVGFTLSLPTSAADNMQVVDVTPPEISVEDIDTSHQNHTGDDVGWMLFVPGELRNGGTLAVEVHYQPDTDPLTFVGVAETAIVLTWPSTATWTFPGYVQSATPGSMPLNQKITGTLNIKVGGKITVAAGAGG